MLYDPTEGSNRLINHIRRCASFNGTNSGRTSTATIAGNTADPHPPPACQPSHRRSLKHIPHTQPHTQRLTNRATTRVADNEFHPNQRTNQSPHPLHTQHLRKHPSHHNLSLTHGSTNSPTAANTGAGNAAVSNLPTGVNGNSPTTANADGTI